MRSLTDGEKALCERLLGPAGTCLLLSGSYARGWQHSHSDVDVIVIDFSHPPSTDEQPDGKADGVTLHVSYIDGKAIEPLITESKLLAR